MSDSIDTIVRATVHEILPGLVRAAVREELRAMLAPTVAAAVEPPYGGMVAVYLRTLAPGSQHAAMALYGAFAGWYRVEYPGEPVPSVRMFGLRAMATGLVYRNEGPHGRVYTIRAT